jgi:hypothetical protein
MTLNVNNERSVRKHLRNATSFSARLLWTDSQGRRRFVQCEARNLSRGGACFDSPEALPVGAAISVEAPKVNAIGQAVVRHCAASPVAWIIGIEFDEDLQASVRTPGAERIDYYETLQINPAADDETVHRVFRIMASRFHPDNPLSGDTERFLRLREAYEILSDPEKRARYDARYFRESGGPMPVFQLKEFVDEVGGEMNRRLGLLCLLYNQRRKSPDKPGLSVLELERMMSLPREYLTFTLWYLQESQFVRMTETSDFALTAVGVNQVEESLPKNHIAQRLLTNRGPSAFEAATPSHAWPSADGSAPKSVVV